jgi:hypothetical protein
MMIAYVTCNSTYVVFGDECIAANARASDIVGATLAYPVDVGERLIFLRPGKERVVTTKVKAVIVSDNVA